jgi:rare lipoprotein A
VALLLAASAAVALAGCSVRLGEPADGPGAAIDPDTLPEVVPRSEPKSRYGNPESYVVHGKRYHVRDSAEGYVAEGLASWYGSKFHGRRTSSGEPYNMYALTAAHRTLPLPTYARVTNLENGRSTVLKINDRGPFHDDRIIDLSYAAATRLGVVEAGTARVRVRALTPGTPTERKADTGGAGAGGTTQTGPVFIQVGAFARFGNAQEMRARVQGADIRGVEVSRGETAGGDRVYRVRIGPLKTADARRAVLGKLERAGIGPARVVSD